MLVAAAISCCCAGGPAAEAAFRAADAIVVWNPGTGINEAGRKLTKAALADLTNALAKVTGTVPAVYAEGEEPSGAKAAIYLGDTKAARRAGCTDANLRRGDWRILNVPGRAYVFAKSGMGATYAMSDFVERYLGYWFLTPEGDDPYDYNPELRIPLADVTVKPAIYNARIYTANPWYNSFARRRRAPGYPCSEIESGERVSHQTRECHSSFFYLPPEKYFKDHPEWYSMVNGRRQHAPVGQICMSNPEARRECLKNLLAFAAKDRVENPAEYPCIYDFTQQDNMSYLCQCPECQKAIAKYTRGKDPKGHGENYNGGDAGLQLEFINWIATEARKVYPDIKIRTFAYVSTECPPRPGTIVPADNVRIWWCDLYGESEHHRAITDGPFNHKRAEQIEEWMKIAKDVEVWDYMLYGGSYTGDYPEWSPDAIAGDAKFFARNHLSSLFMECERMGGPAHGLSELPQAFYDLNFYLLSVYYTYPDADLDALVKNYCRVYGKGADGMLKALAFLREITMANPAKTCADWHQRRCPWRTVVNWARFRALVKAAYDAEEAGPARTRIARVMASVSIELARLYAQDPKGKERCEAARRDYESYGLEYVRGQKIKEDWRKKMLKCIETKIALFNLKFKDMPEGLEGVPDDEIRCADWHRFSGSANSSTRDDPDSETGKGRVWQFGKDGTIHKGFPIPCFMYDGVSRSGQNYKITSDMAAKDEKYHWYKLGPGCVGSGSLFAMPGDWHMTFRFADWYIQKDGLPVDPNWYDVYLSAKFTGPAYVPGSTKPNGIWFDRLLLRRIAPPGKK